MLRFVQVVRSHPYFGTAVLPSRSPSAPPDEDNDTFVRTSWLDNGNTDDEIEINVTSPNTPPGPQEKQLAGNWSDAEKALTYFKTEFPDLPADVKLSHNVLAPRGRQTVLEGNSMGSEQPIDYIWVGPIQIPMPLGTSELVRYTENLTSRLRMRNLHLPQHVWDYVDRWEAGLARGEHVKPDDAVAEEMRQYMQDVEGRVKEYKTANCLERALLLANYLKTNGHPEVRLMWLRYYVNLGDLQDTGPRELPINHIYSDHVFPVIGMPKWSDRNLADWEDMDAPWRQTAVIVDPNFDTPLRVPGAEEWYQRHHPIFKRYLKRSLKPHTEDIYPGIHDFWTTYI